MLQLPWNHHRQHQHHQEGHTAKIRRTGASEYNSTSLQVKSCLFILFRMTPPEPAVRFLLLRGILSDSRDPLFPSKKKDIASTYQAWPSSPPWNPTSWLESATRQIFPGFSPRLYPKNGGTRTACTAL